jgi:hypothetical protein
MQRGRFTSFLVAAMGGILRTLRVSRFALLLVGALFSHVVLAGAGVTSASWTSIGPTNAPGRVKAIAIHPTEPNKIWIGTGNGGIWRSTDGGATWTSAGSLPSLSITAIVMAPGNPNVLYAGTGDAPKDWTQSGFLAVDGAGILRSVDGGLTWAPLPSTNPASNSHWRFVEALAIHPTNASILLASAQGTIYRSADAGTTWNTVGAVGAPIRFAPNDGTKVVVLYGDNPRYSTDAGATWSLGFGLPYAIATTGLAYTHTPGLVYAAAGHDALCCAAAGGVFYRSVNGGATWTQVSVPGHLGTRQLLDQSIWVDPTNSNHVLLGGQDLYRSTDGGASWTQISSGLVAGSLPSGQHTIVAAPGYNGTSNRTIYVGTAGGLFRANDIASASIASGWTALNNGVSTTEFVSAAGHAGTNGRIIGGTLSGGSFLYPGSGTAWTSFLPGAGGHVAIDPSNGNILYGSRRDLRIHRSDTGGAPAADISGGIPTSETTVLHAPFALDPNNPDVMLAGGLSLWRSTNVRAPGPTWTNIRSGDTTGAYHSRTINAIAIAQGDANIVWLATKSDGVYKSTNATAAAPAWSRVGANLFESYDLPATIHIDKDNAQRVFIGFGLPGIYGGKGLQRTVNGGQDWAFVGNGLRSTVLALERHPALPHYLYAGTEHGLFTSENDGVSWSSMNDGPANVPVVHLFWIGNTLHAATQGLGMFRAVVPTPNVFALTIAKSGVGSGPVTSNPAGIACGSRCSAGFAAGTTVTLTVSANPGSYFTGWSGACSGTSNTCVLSMTAARNVTASFSNVPGGNQTLTVSKSGTGSGPVTSSPAGITCGSSCAANFAPGTSVTLTAAPNSGSVFTGWSGACTGTATTCTVSMTQARSVTASYETMRTLSIAKSGNGSGPVTSSPAGIACGSTCSKTFPLGSNVTLTATPNAGSAFIGWSGACTGTAPTCVVAMNTDKAVTATYAQGVRLEVAKAGDGYGSVSSSPAGLNCALPCAAAFPPNSTVTLTLSPTPGYAFTGWSGACSGTSLTCTLVMSAPRQVTATLMYQPLTLTQALDDPNLNWTTSGALPWQAVNWISSDGSDSARSGQVGDNQASILTTTVTGPGTLTFYWQVSSQTGSDFLTFYVDGVANGAGISGDSGWVQRTVSIPPGSHSLEWRYAKDGFGGAGSDRALLDRVQFVPLVPQSPRQTAR